MYYTQISSNAVAGYLVNGLDGLTTYTAAPGQTRLPDLPDLPLPSAGVRSEDSAGFAIAGSRHHDPGRTARLLPDSVRKYGLNFDLLPNYPDELVNPRSQVMSIGAEREVMKGLFVGGDYVHQHWTDLDRTRRSERAVGVRSHGDRPD